LSLERVLKILHDFGLQKKEAKIYIYLAKKGPKTEENLMTTLSLNKYELNFILEKLQTKGIVMLTTEQKALFSALTFEEILDLYVKNNLDQAQEMQQTKNELLFIWRTIAESYIKENDKYQIKQ